LTVPECAAKWLSARWAYFCAVSPDRCLVIEDSPAGIAAAVSAGMTVAGFCGAAHCGPGHASQLRKLGANRVFDRWDAGEFLNGIANDGSQPGMRREIAP